MCESSDCLLVQVEELQQVSDRQTARHVLLCLLLTVSSLVVSKPSTFSVVSLRHDIYISPQVQMAEPFNYISRHVHTFAPLSPALNELWCSHLVFASCCCFLFPQNLSSCLWLLFNRDPGRLYLELQFFCAAANFGQVGVPKSIRVGGSYFHSVLQWWQLFFLSPGISLLWAVWTGQAFYYAAF